MSPAEEQYAAAWLSEMWRPVAEHHQSDAERAAAWSRNTQPVDGAINTREKGGRNVA